MFYVKFIIIMLFKLQKHLNNNLKEIRKAMIRLSESKKKVFDLDTSSLGEYFYIFTKICESSLLFRILYVKNLTCIEMNYQNNLYLFKTQNFTHVCYLLSRGFCT